VDNLPSRPHLGKDMDISLIGAFFMAHGLQWDDASVTPRVHSIMTGQTTV